MFTGIVEEKGTVTAFQRSALGWRLDVAAGTVTQDVRIGDSIAVNGCCLTAVVAEPGKLAFDVLEETRRLTNLDALGPGAGVNLERSLRASDRLGGHFVTGHIDGRGQVMTLEPRGKDRYLRIQAPEGCERYLVQKGSVAVDGVSLTVAEVQGREFAIWLIPHTLEVTALGERRSGDAVNLEFDLLGKYVEKLLQVPSS